MLRIWLALMVTVLAGCATRPNAELLAMPAVSLGVVGAPPASDQRARFRATFCEALRNSEARFANTPCEEFLWRLPDEPQNQAIPPRDGANPLRVLMVGGAFGDCFPPASVPFAGDAAYLRPLGFEIEYVPVSGRSTAESNSDVIEQQVLALAEDGGPIVLVGYSKGTADILEVLTRFPAVANRIAAVVSIAGAVNGSPLANRYAKLYDRFLSGLPIGSCEQGNGGVLDSLVRSKRVSWLAEDPLPKHIRYYSLATFAAANRMARGLKYPHRLLSKIDPRNDGQLLTEDEVIPGSVLLGYANADHWAVAVDLEDRFPFLAHRSLGKHPFPQRSLLQSLLIFVRQDLNMRP